MTNTTANSLEPEGYTIVLTGPPYRKLEEIARKENTSIEDCVQRAISLWLFLHEEATSAKVWYKNDGRVMRVAVP